MIAPARKSFEDSKGALLLRKAPGTSISLVAHHAFTCPQYGDEFWSVARCIASLLNVGARPPKSTTPRILIARCSVYGMTSIQVFRYFHMFPNDNKLVKAMVSCKPAAWYMFFHYDHFRLFSSCQSFVFDLVLFILG